MDDAVTFDVENSLDDDHANVDWMKITPLESNLVCQQAESYDLAFELDTDPNYIKWEQPFTGIRQWPHYEDEESYNQVWDCTVSSS